MKQHVFERAGMGKAPFKYLGFGVETYQAIKGDPSCPIQPGASCDYCGTGISNVFYIESSDGKKSKVGCDCVNKTNDAGLKNLVKDEVNKHKREARHAREEIRITAARAILDDPKIREHLSSKPHPWDNRAAKGETLLDGNEQMWNMCGNSGKIKMARNLEKLQKELTS